MTSYSLRRIPSSIITSQDELTIPKHTLEPGIYILRVTATIVNVGLSESEEAYLVILAEPIYVTIAGGSKRLVSWNEDIILNGSLSYDPNVLKGNARDLNFTWHCQINAASALTEIEKRGCLGYGKTIVKQDSSIQRISGDVFRADALYITTLSAESNVIPGRKSSFKQTIMAQSLAVKELVVQ